MRARRVAVPFAILVLLAPSVVHGQAISDEHSINVNNPLVKPGGEATISVHGPPGNVALRIYRLDDPAAVRGFDERATLGPLTLVEERTVRIVAEYSGAMWGSASVTVSLDGGVYLVETVRGSQTRLAYLQATTASFIVKEGPERGVVWAFRTSDGAPLAGARVIANGTELGRTGENGALEATAARLDGPILLVAPDGAVAAGDMAAQYWWGSGEQGPRVVTHFDRPIYRPGQTVHYKSTAFEARDNRQVPAQPEAIRVKIVTWARGAEEVVHEAVLKPNAYGSVAGSFALAPDAPLGHYSVAVTTADGGNGWAAFEVQAYQKPRIKVEAEAQKPSYVRGEEVLVRANAQWFFGAPVTRGDVRYTVESGPWWGYDCRYCQYAISWRAPYAEGGTVASGRGELRSDGSFVFSFTPTAPADAPMHLTVRVAITAESGEQQTAETTVVVHPSALDVFVETDAWAYRVGDPIELRGRVTDRAGAPVPGQLVRFRVEEERGRDARTIEATTDARGVATATARADRGGSYTIHAIATDAAGREARSVRWVWISDSTARWHNEGAMLIPDKERYQPGETMRLAIATSTPGDYLVTLEGADLHDWKVVRVEGSAIVEFPVRAEHAPGVSLTATTVRPGEHGLNPIQGHADASVGPDPRELRVEVVSDKPAYRDGDEARLLVRVTDAAGNPVVGEVALSVVDASIYALREDHATPLLEALYPRQHNVRTVHAWWSVGGARYSWSAGGGRLFALDAAAPPTAAMVGSNATAFRAVAAEGLADVRVREVFPDTALWLPFVITDEGGYARVRLTAPDTLTEWRMTARAHTLDGLAGEARGAFHTRKPLAIELATPRFLVQGDSLTVTAVIFNNIGELRDVDVELMLEGAIRATGPMTKRVTLSSGDSVRLDFPVVATDNASAVANVTVAAFSAGEPVEQDAMRVRVPVLPHGVAEKAVRAGTDNASFSLRVPGGPHAATPTLTVTLAPSMAASVLDALPYLLGYPYGCVEQTMSRFMPAVVATRALSEAGYDAEDPKVPEYVQAGLDRLARFQHEDGGWGWWEHDASHPYMTAYVVAGLAQAKRAQAPVDEQMLARGIERLRVFQADEKSGDLAAYQAYALAIAGSAPRQWPADDRLSPDGLALVGLARLATGDRAGAERALDALMAKASRSEGRLYWTDEGRGWGPHGIRSDVQLTAHALRLMVGLGREDDAASAVAWLAEQRRGAWWSTTKDTAESVLAIVEHVARSDELRPDHEAVVVIAGQEHRVPFRGEAKDLQRRTIAIDVPVEWHGRELPIEVRREGTGRLYWSAVLASTPRAETILAASNGFTVEKTIQKNGVPVTTLQFNEEYDVVVRVKNEQGRSFVLLRDALPAGVQAIQGSASGGSPYSSWMCFGCGWEGSWSNVEIRDDHVAAFATSLTAGESTLKYRVRAVQPGSYHVLPAHVEEMYRPDVNGRSAELHVEIGDVPRLLIGAALVRDGGVSVRFEPVAGGSLRARDVTAHLLDANGTELPATASVSAADDGTFDVVITAHAPLPPVVTVRVDAPGLPPALRTLDTLGQAVTFEGAFAPELAAAWDAGAPLDATRQPDSARGDPGAFPADPPPQDGRPLPPPADAPQPPPARGVPKAGFALAVAALALVAAARRRAR